jgi:hypothetical protein
MQSANQLRYPAGKVQYIRISRICCAVPVAVLLFVSLKHVIIGTGTGNYLARIFILHFNYGLKFPYLSSLLSDVFSFLIANRGAFTTQDLSSSESKNKNLTQTLCILKKLNNI